VAAGGCGGATITGEKSRLSTSITSSLGDGLFFFLATSGLVRSMASLGFMDRTAQKRKSDSKLVREQEWNPLR
jgi:hypothetical protein